MSIPTHVAIIMDGNGRWAQGRGLERVEGHANGVESVRAAIRAAVGVGVRYLTLYAFSTENWGRPAAEVEALMELLCRSVVSEADELAAQGVRVRVIGDRAGLSDKVREHIARAEAKTALGERLTLILAVNYSATAELTHAVGELVSDGVRGDQVTFEAIRERLYTADMPDPDLVIRTGGERRLSNFLLLQSAYAELHFTGVLWPDFREADFEAALADFAARQRRYGLVEN